MALIGRAGNFDPWHQKLDLRSKIWRMKEYLHFVINLGSIGPQHFAPIGRLKYAPLPQARKFF